MITARDIASSLVLEGKNAKEERRYDDHPFFIMSTGAYLYQPTGDDGGKFAAVLRVHEN